MLSVTGEDKRSIKLFLSFYLLDNLHDKYYEAAQSKQLSQLLSCRVLEEVRRQASGNYKLVAVVSIGSVREKPGVQLGSRCLWNKETDRFITAKYSNRSLFAVAMVYGLHYDWYETEKLGHEKQCEQIKVVNISKVLWYKSQKLKIGFVRRCSVLIGSARKSRCWAKE